MCSYCHLLSAGSLSIAAKEKDEGACTGKETLTTLANIDLLASLKSTPA